MIKCAAVLLLAAISTCRAQTAQWGAEQADVSAKKVASESAEGQRARTDFEAYASALGMPAPLELKNKESLRGAAEAQEYGRFFQKYRGLYTGCATGGRCDDKFGLTADKFKAAMDGWTNQGKDWDAGSRKLCGLVRASEGYFGFFGSEYERHALILGADYADASAVTNEVVVAYKELFNQVYHTHLNCSSDFSKGCDLVTSECGMRVREAGLAAKAQKGGGAKGSSKPCVTAHDALGNEISAPCPTIHSN